MVREKRSFQTKHSPHLNLLNFPDTEKDEFYTVLWARLCWEALTPYLQFFQMLLTFIAEPSMDQSMRFMQSSTQVPG